MPITYTNNFLQYDKNIVAFQENDQEITYGYVEEAVKKNLLIPNSIWSTIHCFNKSNYEFDTEDELWFSEVLTTETQSYAVCPTNSLYRAASGYTNVNIGMFGTAVKSLSMRKATFLEACMLIKDNDSGMIGATEEIKKLVHDKFREMLIPSFKMFILGHNDVKSVINIIPKDVVLEIITLSNR